MKTSVRITIESKKVMKIVRDEGDDRIDRAASKEFQKDIHAAIAGVIERFVTDSDGRFEEEIAEWLDFDWDSERIFNDTSAPELSDLGEIKITVKATAQGPDADSEPISS